MLELITKKRLILATILFVIIAISIVLFNYSFLTITNSSDEERTVYIRKGAESQNFILKKESKRLFLSKGNYFIEVSNEDKFTSYEQSLGRIWSPKTIDTELLPQKSSTFLGKSKLQCARSNDAVIIDFYSCNPSSQGLIGKDKTPAEAADLPVESRDISIALKPYKQKFLEAKKEGSSVSFVQKNSNGLSEGGSEVKIDNFEGSLDDSSFAVSSFGDSFAIFDNNKNVLYYFDNLSAKPKTFDIELEDGPDYLSSTFVGQKNVYVYSIPFPEEDESTEDLATDESIGGSRVTSIDLIKNKVDKEHKIPKDWEIKNLFAFGESQVMAVLGGEKTGETFVFEGSLVKQVTIAPEEISEACPKDRDTIYIKSDSGKSIYEYSESKNASFLVYSSQVNFISSINCVDGHLYFVLDTETDGEISSLLHFALGEKEHRGARLEAVLPIYTQINRDVLEVTQLNNSVVAGIISDGDNNGPPDKNLAKEQIIQLLKDKSVDTNGLQINFAY